MGSTIEFVEYVCDQIKGVGSVRSRKMFGEYMVYVNDKPTLLVCNNTVYIKMHKSIDTMMEECKKGCPYNGAKEHYILDIDNVAFSEEVIKVLEPNLKVPKPRKKKEKK